MQLYRKKENIKVLTLKIKRRKIPKLLAARPKSVQSIISLTATKNGEQVRVKPSGLAEADKEV